MPIPPSEGTTPTGVLPPGHPAVPLTSSNEMGTHPISRLPKRPTTRVKRPAASGVTTSLAERVICPVNAPLGLMFIGSLPILGMLPNLWRNLAAPKVCAASNRRRG